MASVEKGFASNISIESEPKKVVEKVTKKAGKKTIEESKEVENGDSST